MYYVIFRNEEGHDSIESMMQAELERRLNIGYYGTDIRFAKNRRR